MMDNGIGTRVLIAEDDYLVSETIKSILHQIGYTVVGKAMDGQEAIEMTQALEPDVVLMDIEMPGISGIEATRCIQAVCPTPVVILTAYETPDLVGEASAAGAGAYLVKPPDVKHLKRAITIAMARFDDMMALCESNQQLQAAMARLKDTQQQVIQQERLAAVGQLAAGIAH
ncbi:MAG TPA: response regulator, partial [Chloroflexi bacterium]|nr:response regulator [Chloroflexota bacterium]